ncbi:hypothetical protein ElyMa_004646800 [Elysia marginata]|uniref:MADF domain-containing protein n=1 Tax=Elysia marginata TaxID=1093978 RepID=A0AAV4I1Y4_9GAST|nr:hypothetical protein ElyMa_004646800 [Elysia marginata]
MWGPDSTLLFIEAYRSAECLWNIKSKAYSNRYLKQKAFENLIKLCRDFDPNVNKDTIAKKINNIRTSFRRELKKKEAYKGSDEEYQPKLWYFNQLLFLVDQETPSQSCSDTSLEQDAPQDDADDDTIELDFDIDKFESEPNSPCSYVELDEGFALNALHPRPSAGTGTEEPAHLEIKHENQVQQDYRTVTVAESSSHIAEPSTLGQARAPQPRPTGSPAATAASAPGRASYASSTTTSARLTSHRPPQVNKRYPRDGRDESVLEIALAKLLTPPAAPDEDECDVFGRSVAHRLRALSHMQKILARKYISDVLFEAELGELSRQTPTHLYHSMHPSSSAVRQNFDRQSTQGSEESYNTQHRNSPRFHPYHQKR